MEQGIQTVFRDFTDRVMPVSHRSQYSRLHNPQSRGMIIEERRHGGWIDHWSHRLYLSTEVKLQAPVAEYIVFKKNSGRWMRNTNSITPPSVAPKSEGLHHWGDPKRKRSQREAGYTATVIDVQLAFSHDSRCRGAARWHDRGGQWTRITTCAVARHPSLLAQKCEGLWRCSRRAVIREDNAAGNLAVS